MNIIRGPVAWANSLLLSALALLSVAVAQESLDPDAEKFVVGSVIVNRSAIFEPSQAHQRLVYQIVNSLHKVTREETIVKETGLVPGAELDAADVAEVERLLRRTGLFASVAIRLEPTGLKGMADVHVYTRDRLSVVAGASGSLLGGVGEIGFTVGERNVAGLGDTVLFTYSGNTNNEARGAVSYRDLHFLNSRQRALYSAGKTEEGSFYSLQFSRPFKTLAETRSWAVRIASSGQDIDFYQDGRSVVQIPEQRDTLAFDSFWRSGSREMSWRRGLSVSYNDRVYLASRGSQAPSIAAPADSRRTFAGVVLALDQHFGFRKVRGVDTLRFTQDLALARTASVTIGLAHERLSDSSQVRLNPLISGQLAGSFAVGDSSFYRLSLKGSATLRALNSDDEDQQRGWSLVTSAKAFNKQFDSHTIAARIDYTVADGGDGLPVQQTLGENNGLRGYPSRFFSGRQRLRINLEDRYDPGWRVGVFDFGITGFFDAGWAAEEDEPDRSLKKSIGAGLRMGSNALLGAGVIRFDLAFPLDRDDRKPLFSIALGQVFSF